MDKVKITLPCGFEITYERLKTGQNVIRCKMCDKEDMVVEDVLNQPANDLRLKTKKLELNVENLKKLKFELSLNKTLVFMSNKVSNEFSMNRTLEKKKL